MPAKRQTSRQRLLGPSENDVVALPGGELAAFYRNMDGPATGYSTNIPLCVQVSPPPPPPPVSL